MSEVVKKVFKALTWNRFEKREAKIAQSRIRNHDFSIITSNCCGGWIYHMLGMRFDSPTINTWIDKKEFCIALGLGFGGLLDGFPLDLLGVNRTCHEAPYGNKE